MSGTERVDCSAMLSPVACDLGSCRQRKIVVLLLGQCKELGRLLCLHLDQVSERHIDVNLSSYCIHRILLIEETRNF